MTGANGANGEKPAMHATAPNPRGGNEKPMWREVPSGRSVAAGVEESPPFAPPRNGALEPTASFPPFPPFPPDSDAPPPDDREPEPFREPEPCPACGGTGVAGDRPDEFGNWEPCELCEGTAIDPADPASPL
jgi:hypothetical protein